MQYLWKLVKLVMSHLLISTQLAQLTQLFAAEMLHLKVPVLTNSNHLKPAAFSPQELERSHFSLFFFLFLPLQISLEILTLTDIRAC